jgi:hypothetical protein
MQNEIMFFDFIIKFTNKIFETKSSKYFQDLVLFQSFLFNLNEFLTLLESNEEF